MTPLGIVTVVRNLGDNWSLVPRIVGKGELKLFHRSSLMKSSTNLIFPESSKDAQYYIECLILMIEEDDDERNVCDKSWGYFCKKKERERP